MSKRSTPETAVVRDCLAFLQAVGIFAWRNNTGALQTKAGGFVRFGVVGSADIFALHCGKFMAIECKAGKAKPTVAQLMWGQSVKECGGYWWVVYSADELRSYLNDHFSGVSK